MQIQDVQNLAELAKLELKEGEAEKLIKDMEGILDYVKQIENVEVPEIGMEYLNRNVWREDEILLNEDSKDVIVEQFPDSKDGFLKVNKIL